MAQNVEDIKTICWREIAKLGLNLFNYMGLNLGQFEPNFVPIK